MVSKCSFLGYSLRSEQVFNQQSEDIFGKWGSVLQIGPLWLELLE